MQVNSSRPENRRSKDGVRANRDIVAHRVRVIDTDGKNIGLFNIRDALIRAEEAGLDLVEISSTPSEVVCRIMDFGRYKYMLQKRKNEAKKNQKQASIKEVKLRPNINAHDYDVKFRSIQKFLTEGNKVKVKLRFRGREVVYQKAGFELLKRVETELGERCRMEQMPNMEGKQLMMILAPQVN